MAAQTQTQALAQDPTAPRVVVLGGTLTETVYALGRGEWVAGVDQSSYYPAQTADLPKLNYHRNISAEGVLSLSPTMVLYTEEAGPPPALRQLADAGVEMHLIEGDDTTSGALQRVERVGAVLGAEGKAAELAAELRGDLARLREYTDRLERKPRLLFVYARGAGTVMVGGAGTGAAQMIELAGGVNAASGFKDYRPLTAEAVLNASPDYILMMDKGLKSLGGEKALLGMPGFALTEAGQRGQVVAMDDQFLLGFGPRLGQAALELARAIHPDAKDLAGVVR